MASYVNGVYVGSRDRSKKCTWCKKYEVYKCGYAPHGSLSCSKCNSDDLVCASASHPSNKPRNKI